MKVLILDWSNGPHSLMIAAALQALVSSRSSDCIITIETGGYSDAILYDLTPEQIFPCPLAASGLSIDASSRTRRVRIEEFDGVGYTVVVACDRALFGELCAARRTENRGFNAPVYLFDCGPDDAALDSEDGVRTFGTRLLGVRENMLVQLAGMTLVPVSV